MSVELKRGSVCVDKNVTDMVGESLGGYIYDHIERFEYKKATMKDVDELVRTRIIVLRAANKLSDDGVLRPCVMRTLRPSTCSRCRAHSPR